MQLKIEDFAVVDKIDINFEELKSEVATTMQDYLGLTYSDEEIPQAKKDLARMRKFVKALDDARKNVKAELLKPYAEFERKLNEIKSLVNEPVALIDNQIKEYEYGKKQEKAKAIADYYNGIENKPAYNILDVIANPKWENATYSMSTICKEIDEAVKKYHNGMATLSKLTEFRFEAIQEFEKTLDLGKALEKQVALKEQAKLKKEALAEEIEDTASAKTWVGFMAYMTPSEARLLREFCEVNEIPVKPIEKGE